MRAWIVSYRPSRLKIVSRPVLQLFSDCQFIFRPRGSWLGEPLPFEWVALNTTLPSLRGEITLHRFGPLVLLVVDVDFETASDVPGRLLNESVGKKMATRSLRYLSEALYRAMTTPRARVPATS